MGSISQSISSARCDMCWRLHGNHTEADLGNQFRDQADGLCLLRPARQARSRCSVCVGRAGMKSCSTCGGAGMSPNGSRQVRVCSECKRRGYLHHEFSVAMRADRKETARTSKPSCHRQTLMSAQNPQTGRTRRPASRRTQRYDPPMDGRQKPSTTKMVVFYTLFGVVILQFPYACGLKYLNWDEDEWAWIRELRHGRLDESMAVKSNTAWRF